jgi:release factor glutamine methyltransferase
MLARTADTVGSRTEALWMCRCASGTDATEFVEIIGSPVTERAGSHLAHLVARRLSGEPIQYVLGSWEFRRLELMIDRRVLIPRPETEQMVDIALAHLGRSRDGRNAIAVDLGTGSGAIGLSLLAESGRGTLTTWMTDRSADALDVARANAAGLGVAAGGARFALGDWWDALPEDLAGRVDLVCANPPYVADGDPEAAPEVIAWEPRDAVFAGPDGLESIRRILDGAPRWLAPGGAIVVEIGHRQAEATTATMRAAGFDEVEVLVDAAGRDRFVTAIRPRGDA